METVVLIRRWLLFDHHYKLLIGRRECRSGLLGPEAGRWSVTCKKGSDETSPSDTTYYGALWCHSWSQVNQTNEAHSIPPRVMRKNNTTKYSKSQQHLISNSPTHYSPIRADTSFYRHRSRDHHRSILTDIFLAMLRGTGCSRKIYQKPIISAGISGVKSIVKHRGLEFSPLLSVI